MTIATPLLTWDVTQFLANAQNITTTVGGSLMTVLGVIAVLVAVFKGFSKMTSEQSRSSWPKIIGLFVLGGMMIAGGISLFISMASGVKGTVDMLGASVALPVAPILFG